jgi:hypothetical protein
VIETVGALPPGRRRRRKPEPERVEDDRPRQVPVTVATVILADDPFESEEQASVWLEGIDQEQSDELLSEAFAVLDRLLATTAAATGRPYVTIWGDDQALAARIGIADGTEAADGRFRDAVRIDVRGGTATPRRDRAARTMPLSRIAAVLRGRDRPRSCELLIPRVSSDLRAGRQLAAACAIETAIAVTVREMADAMDEPSHRDDLEALRAMLPDLTELTDAAIEATEPWPGLDEALGEPLEIAERVIRRVRLLDP